jgi:DnaJ-class molecular chaperone
VNGQAGKGSKYRPYNVGAFHEGHDRAFGKRETPCALCEDRGYCEEDCPECMGEKIVKED